MQAQAPRAALPIVAVTGSVGKTTTATLLDRLARGAGWRTVTWLDDGVAIDGYPQAGELLPWGQGLQLILRRELQLAIQELPAPTVQAVGLPAAAYQAAIITNLAMNDPELAGTEASARQAAANQAVAAAVHPDGWLVLNADDLAVADLAGASAATPVLWALRRQSPPLARHLRAGGAGLFIADGRIVWEAAGQVVDLGAVAALPFTLGGAALPQVQNGLAALGAALALGLPAERLRPALARIEELPRLAERLVTLRRGLSCRVIVAEARGLLAFRAVARSMRRFGPGESRVIGAVAWPDGLAEVEARAAARTLARRYDLLYLHGRASEAAAELVRAARPTHRLPAFCVAVESESEAIRRLVNVAAAGDRLLLIGARAAATLALLESFRPEFA
jgi:UDP-N-acetylmuramyl pentapeptide synthase